MKYSDEILNQVNYINSLLNRYNEEPILKNKNFIVDEISWRKYLKISFKKSDNISFDIICSSSEFQMNIDRTNEVLDLNSSDFYKNKPLVKDFFYYLFACRKKVEYCGSNYTKITFYNDNGDCIKTLKYLTGLYLKIRCKIKEYPPIYR